MPQCMNQEQYKRLKVLLGSLNEREITFDKLEEISKLHSELWRHKYLRPCRCEPATWKLWIVDLTFIKMTDNRLGFGKKIIWEKK